MWGVRAIAAGVWQVRAVASSVYVLEGHDGSVTLLDAGAIGSAGRVLRVVERLGFPADRVRTVALSHHHVDHSGALSRLIALTGAQSAAHVLDVPFISDPPPDWRRLGALRGTSRAVWLFLRSRRVQIDVPLSEGDRLPGVEQFRVIHTPGHTPGSISLWDEQRGLLIVGDAFNFRFGILSRPSLIFSTDMAEAYRTIRKLAALDVQTLAFAHFPPLTERTSARLRSLAASLGAVPPVPTGRELEQVEPD